MLSNEVIPTTTRLFFNWRKWVFIFKVDLGVRWMIKISLSTFLNIFKRQNRHQGHKIMIVLTKLTNFEIEASGKNTDIKIIYQFGEMKITSFVVPAKYISQGHTIHYASHWRLPSFQSWTEPLQGNEQLLEGLSKQPCAGHNLFLEKFLVWSSKSNRSVFVNLVLPWNHPDNRYLIFLFNSYHCSIVLPW